MALPPVPSLNPTPLQGFQPSAPANPFANFLSGLTQGIELRREREKDAHLAALQLRDQAFKEKEADRNYNLAEREFDALAKYRNDTIGLQERDLELRDKKFEVDRDQAYSTMEMQNIAMEQARREQEEELRVRSSQAELRAQTQEAIRLSRPPQTRPSSTGLTKPNGDPLMISGKFNVFSGTRDQLKSRNSKPGNRIVSLDFNDADNQSARGIEIVVPENATDEEVDAARQWVQQTHSFFKRHGVDVPIRRGDGIKRGGRGVSGFFHTEPFFVSNADAAKAIEANSDEYAEIMAGTLGNIPGATFIAPHKQNDPGASRDGINERDFAMQTILPSLQRISQSGRQSNEKQLENLRGIERRFSDLGPAEQAMIQAERNRIRAEDPDAFDRDAASRQLQVINAAAVGSGRREALEADFSEEMAALARGERLDDGAVNVIVETLNEIAPVSSGLKPLTAGQTNTLAQRRNFIEALNDSLEIIDVGSFSKDELGPIQGRINKMKEFIGLPLDRKYTEFASAFNDILDQLARGRTGAAFTNQEAKRFLTIMGNPAGMDAASFVQRLKTFAQREVGNFTREVNIMTAGRQVTPELMESLRLPERMLNLEAPAVPDFDQSGVPITATGPNGEKLILNQETQTWEALR